MNKHRKDKYGKLSAKLAITNPREALCVELIGPYTHKGKDKSQVDFMCNTTIHPATRWFGIFELPISQLPEVDIPMGTKVQKGMELHVQMTQPYFDKMSVTAGTIVNMTWFSHDPCSQC